MAKERIIIADDHPTFRLGMRHILARGFPDAAIEEAGTFQELMELAAAGPPPTLLQLDIFFPGFDPPASITALRMRFPRATIVVVSMTDRYALVEAVMAAGADGFLTKALPPNEFVDGIRSIRDGEILVRHTAPGMIVPKGDGALRMLTLRQMEVLRLVAEGMTNKEIGRRLGLSPVTVRMHVSDILKALGVSTRTAAAAALSSIG